MSNEWIENIGGCPVVYGTLVDVQHRDGREYLSQPAGDRQGMAGDWWVHEENPCTGDIMFWRLSVKEPFFGLEEAYNNGTLVRPVTKPVEVVKKSAEQMVADAFNQQWDINLREDDIQRIIVAVQALKDLEK